MDIPTSHRPWPTPSRPWAMFMRWHDLMFMHWDVPAKSLRPLIPSGLELDTFDGRAWLGVVPFHMSGIRHHYLPPIPGLAAFPELNVRTYVTADGKPGVWFFSLDATSKISVRGARWLFHLNYYDARIRCSREDNSSKGCRIKYESRRTHRGAPPAEFQATYGPAGKSFQAKPGTLEYFLTERYCLYAADKRGTVYRSDIAHAPWSLYPAESDTQLNSMAAPLGISTDGPPLLHFADDQEVVAWIIERV